ncbi:MAG: 50S ribosomal protein L11 methyltransferase [Cyclobacteriaceae bacterium]|jgi:ribosomal protein L11 methyltransferase
MHRVYKVLTFLCDQIISDILVAELSNIGFDSFLITDTGFEASISLDQFDQKILDELIDSYSSLGAITCQSNEIREKNWNIEWERNFQPIVVEDQCVVRATFHKIKKNYPVELIINPKMSFGTGHHETTYLMIQNQLNTDHKHKRVLDAGCGTGILSVLAEKLGADKIIGFDTDHWAFENSLENIRLNSCHRIKIIQGRIEKISSQDTFDIILANINLNVIIEDLNSYYELLPPRGILILSGFLVSDLNTLLESIEDLNITLMEQNSRNKWMSVILKKNQ